MARHRRRPVPRHRAGGSGSNSGAARPPGRRLGSAMRRVVVTPTFAAGLGVVVAAVLAYPMRTVFNYAGPAGAPCQTASCGFSNDGKAPPLGSGNRMKTPGPSGTNGSKSAQHGSRDPDGHGQAGVPQLTYHTYGKGQWGFEGTIEITFQAKHAHDRWWLRFGYPSARILRVWAGKELKHSTHWAKVGSWDWPSGGLIRISIGVAGHPGPPRRCTFNGRPCHIVERLGDGAGGGAGTGAGGGAGHGHPGSTGHGGGAGTGAGSGSCAGTGSGTGHEHKGG